MKLTPNQIVNALQKQLTETEQMFKNRYNPNYIAGYLQGVIEITIEELKKIDKIELPK